jgi:hypothetical protein
MTDYDVGYRKPPQHSQFKKGVSGNPRGRPKRPTHAMPKWYEEEMKAIIRLEAYRLVEINENGKQIKVPLIQAIIRRQGVSAAQGRPHAMRSFIEMLRSIEEGSASAYEAYAKTLIDYKTEVGREYERRKKLNPAEPEPLPHPDDIIISPLTGAVELRGPMTEREKAVWDRIEKSDAAIAELEESLAKDPDNPDNEFIKEELDHERRIRKLLARVVPDYRPRPSRRVARQEAMKRAFKSFFE